MEQGFLYYKFERILSKDGVLEAEFQPTWEGPVPAGGCDVLVPLKPRFMDRDTVEQERQKLAQSAPRHPGIKRKQMPEYNNAMSAFDEAATHNTAEEPGSFRYSLVSGLNLFGLWLK